MHGGAGGGIGGGFGEPKDPWEELVASNPEPRNWKGIVISILVILSVIFLVSLSVMWMTPPDPGPRVTGERIRLNDILDDKFKPTRYNATYVGSSVVYMNEQGGLSIFTPDNLNNNKLLDNTTFRTLNSQHYRVDPGMEYVMIIFDIQSIFRHSFLAKYTIQNIQNKTKPLLRLGVEMGTDRIHDQEFLQYANFRPGGGVVFVARNDIFFLDFLDGSGTVRQLTESGSPGTVYNGVADWLYEEEILGRTNAIWFSDEGSKMLYATYNDTDVDLVTLREYGNQNYRTSRIREKSFRYPKAGARNPTVSLSVYVFDGEEAGSTFTVQPPSNLQHREHYFVTAKWISEMRVSVLWTNRAQNISYYTICHHPQYLCEEIYVEKAEDIPGAGWVDNWGLPHFSQDGSSMIKIHPCRDGEAGYYPQLVLIPVSTTDILPPQQLTHGSFEVTKIHGWDEDLGYVYYSGTVEGRPGERHLFRVLLSDQVNHPELLEVDGQPDCLYSEVHLSPNFDSYVKECLGPDIPRTSIVSLPNNTFLKLLDNNNKLEKQLEVSSMPKYRFLEVKLPDSLVAAQVKLTLPPVYRDSEDYKFPLIVNVYGGPGTQTVDRRWIVGWDTYLASNRDFIVANIDVRGSGFQGLTFKHAVKGRLGTFETEDILHVVRHLVSSLKYVDESKVCIWGWSYGGYLTGRVIAEDGLNSVQGRSHVFSCGISVAPVTEWQHYDSAYTEKYMGMPTPEGNWKGYSEASLSNKVEYIRDNTFMVLHGTADDNVHIQHTMVLSKKLVQNHIIFRQQLYPDENHGLFGVIKHQHLSMEAFLDDVFGPIEDFFKDDYYIAAANLLNKMRMEGKEEEEEETCYLC